MVNVFYHEKLYQAQIPHPQLEILRHSSQAAGKPAYVDHPEALTHWTNQEQPVRRRASPTYTGLAIETMVTLQALYGLTGQQTEGLLASIFALMQLPLAVPDHSTFSRRRGEVRVPLPVHPTQRARHVVVNSSGGKVHGEVEWKVRQHGWSKRRTWRKLHLGVDEVTHKILSARATSPQGSDAGGVTHRVAGQDGAGQRGWEL